jgi:two-component system response regulator NreC
VASKVVGSYIGKPSAESSPRAGDLSERESEVLRLIAWGYSNKEIAAQLGISVKTVETYKTRLMEKLGLYSRVDLVRFALRQGWLQER